jgi:hypothetical protein
VWYLEVRAHRDRRVSRFTRISSISAMPPTTDHNNGRDGDRRREFEAIALHFPEEASVRLIESLLSKAIR